MMPDYSDPIPWSQRTREERIEFALRAWRLATPAVLLLGLAVLMMWPVWLPGPVMPLLAYLGLCTWSLRRPDLLHPSVAFLIGLTQDLLMGGAVGIEAALFALTCFALRTQAPVFAVRPFHFEWMIVAALLVVHQLLSAALTALVWRSGGSALGLSVQVAISLLMYPGVVWFFARVQRKIVDRF